MLTDTSIETNFEDTQILSLAAVAPPKVLLVDDDELMLEHLKTLVAAAGYSVTTASGGEAALEALEREFSPIVILDRNMPGMDGLALCRAIRERMYSGYVYLMLLTVQDSEGDILAGLDAGADDYLSKRASNAQLVARLRTARRILSLEQSLRTMLEERRQMAMTDSLTGAHNRRYFVRHLGRELKRIARHGGELSLLALDIDHFKRINDGYGHAAGDEVLKQLVQRVQKSLPREYDWCARLGGEEFAVVLPYTGLAGAKVVAEKLRSNIAAEPMRIGSELLPVTVSVGVSSLEVLGAVVTVETLLADADRYLYQSKEKGRNCVSSPE